MKCCYSLGYEVELPPGHPFPMSKYPLLKSLLLAEGTIAPGDIIEPEALGTSTLELVHTEPLGSGDAAARPALVGGALAAISNGGGGNPADGAHRA
jgi:hypothetical protein